MELIVSLASVAVFTVIVAVLFYVSSQKDGFDKDAKALLSPDAGKTKPKKVAKTKSEISRKIINQKAKDINLNMLQSRLGALPDLEPEYISFLSGHLLKLSQQIQTLEKTVVNTEAAKTAAEHRIELHKDARVTAEAKIAELKAANSELKGRVFKLAAAQQEILNQAKDLNGSKDALSGNFSKSREENKQLRAQMTKLREELTNTKQELSAAKKMTSVVDALEKEKAELAGRVQKLETAAHLHHVDISSLKKKNNELTKKSLALEQTVSEMKESLVEEQKEKDAVIRLYSEEKRQWQEEEARLAVETSETRMLLAGIEAEFHKFEQTNTSIREQREELLTENVKLFNENQQLVAVHLDLTARCDQLETRLSEVHSQSSSPEKNGAKISGNIHETALLKLQHELVRLEKQGKKKKLAREEMEDMVRLMEKAQHSTIEETLARHRATRDSIESVQAAVGEAMATLISDTTA